MRVPVLIAALFHVTSCCVVAQQARAVDPTTRQVLERMVNPKWKERRVALNDALTLLISTKQSANDADKLRLGVIQLLTLENKLNKTPTDAAERRLTKDEDVDGPVDTTVPPGTWSEERSDYYADLIGAVANLNDERAIPVLLAAAHTGGMATQGVARFGKKALDPTLEQVKGPDSELAVGALFVILEMLNLRTVSDPDSHLRIKNALRTALVSPDPERRDSAVSAVEHLDDREEFVPILKELAERDPAKLSGQPQYDGSIGDIYFVRLSATRVLQSIAKHERPPARPIQGR